MTADGIRRDITAEPQGSGQPSRGRVSGVWIFAPSIAGIQPGAFAGTVRLENRHAAGDQTMSEELEVNYDLTVISHV